MKKALVIGASRGIGLELVKQYLAAGWRVHATVRSDSPELSPGSDLNIHTLDVKNRSEIAALVDALRSERLDVVVHNAGVGRGTPRAEMMEINAEAPIRVVEALLEGGVVSDGGKVAIVTSQMGARRGSTESLGDYGDSKAALNDEFRARAPRWEAAFGVVAIVVHPGWVRTDMGGKSAPLSTEESASSMLTLIDQLSSRQHGQFLTWDGRQHPW